MWGLGDLATVLSTPLHNTSPQQKYALLLFTEISWHYYLQHLEIPLPDLTWIR